MKISCLINAFIPDFVQSHMNHSYDWVTSFKHFCQVKNEIELVLSSISAIDSSWMSLLDYYTHSYPLKANDVTFWNVCRLPSNKAGPTIRQTHRLGRTSRWTRALTFVTFAEAGTHGLRTARQLSVHHGGLRREEGGEEGRKGRKKEVDVSEEQRSEELRQGKSKRADASWCIGWLLCIGAERWESDTDKVWGGGTERESESEREREGERKSGRKHECLFADDFESPPLYFFCSPPTHSFFYIQLYKADSSCEWRV